MFGDVHKLLRVGAGIHPLCYTLYCARVLSKPLLVFNKGSENWQYVSNFAQNKHYLLRQICTSGKASERWLLN